MDPTLDGDNNAGSEGEAKMDEARKARRRLLKLGAATAPLVLTFKPSSAWATSAGCVLYQGKMETPGEIVKVDSYFRPFRNDNGIRYRKRQGQWFYKFRGTWYHETKGPRANQRFKQIYVNKGPGDVVRAGNIDHNRLRALVYNDNMGFSCLSSIYHSA